MDTSSVVWVMDDGQASTPRTRKKAKKKMEFVGWGSRELIEFLHSIGKDTTKALTHYDVTNIVTQYVIDSKLMNPNKKKRVNCDERLQMLFGGRKQSIFRNKIHDLLEPHLTENHDHSEDDGSDSEEDTSAASKRQKVVTSDTKTLLKQKVAEVPKNSLAAMSSENIKLVYLKRSLVQELLANPEKFESKVVGSFVKVKADKYDIYQKNSHQLEIVKGVKKAASSGDHKPPMLRLASMFDDISISMLSDDNFSEEECEDLRRRIKEGLLKQPTVGELEEKVVMLHKDITKHWLARELVLLKIRLDQANEKGWRHKVAEYVDRRKLLQTPDEQSRLLSEIPRVLPEKLEPETILDDPLDGVNQNPDDSPKAADWDREAVGMSTRVPSKQRSQDLFEVGTRTAADAQPSSPEDSSPSVREQVTTECNGNFKLMEPDLIRFNGVKASETERYSCADSMYLAQKGIPKTEAFSAGSIGQLLQNSMQVNVLLDVKTSRNVEIITLSDDEDEPKPPSSITPALPDPEHFCWFYLDPMSRVQGPCSLTSLKRWSESGYFQQEFRVWMTGQTPKEAVLLTDILGCAFPR